MRIDHSPGTLDAQLDPERPGISIIRAVESNGAAHLVARCASHEADILVRSRQVPHSCGHADCPGGIVERAVTALAPLRQDARLVVDAFAALPFDRVVAAVGQERAEALWGLVAALESRLPPPREGGGLS